MKLVLRLLGYMRPYVLYWVFSVLLMGVVGALAAFRILLIKPIIDNVLSAASAPDKVLNFVIPHTHVHVNLQVLLPRHFHNAWTVVAVALVPQRSSRTYATTSVHYWPTRQGSG